MGTFGAPVQSDNVEVESQDLSGLDATQEVLDINDPRLTSEDLNVNVDGDAYAFPPPPPDAKYRAKIKVLKVKDASNGEHDFIPKMHATGPYLQSAVDATILDATGKHDGIHVYDRWVGTFVSKRDQSSKVQTILKLLHRPDGKPWIAVGFKSNHKGWMDLFQQALAGEPEIGIVTEWEWNCQTCGEEAKKKGEAYPKSIKGINKFPQDIEASKKAGHAVYSPELQCQVNKAHGYSRCQVRIARFVPLSEVK